MAKQCSFCTKRATTMVSDDSDFFDCCAGCKVAWNGNPGFIRPEEKKFTDSAGRVLSESMRSVANYSDDKHRHSLDRP